MDILIVITSLLVTFFPGSTTNCVLYKNLLSFYLQHLQTVLVAMSAQMLMELVMSKWNFQINIKESSHLSILIVVKPSTAPKGMKSFINQLAWLAERNGWECK